MLLRPDAQTLKDLAGLRNDARFSRVEEWLEKSLEACHDNSRTVEDNALYKCLGASIVLHDFIEYVQTSDDHLARIAQNDPEGTAAS